MGITFVKPVTTIPRKGSTVAISTQLERASSLLRVTYSLNIKNLSDGYHIGLLIMAALRYLAPKFLEEGRLCWLRSPLYIVKNGKLETYYFSDEEFERARGKRGETVTRAKGLGALSEEQARNSMFGESQRMDVIEPTPEAIGLLEDLMGVDVEPRREFIFKNVDFSEIKE